MLLLALAVAPPLFVDVAPTLALADLMARRLCTADLSGDGRPDVIVRQQEAGKPDRYRVFLNTSGDAGPLAFTEVVASGLPAPANAGDCLVFADFDNDGKADALLTRYLDINDAKYAEPQEPKNTAILPGNGDGTFGAPRVIDGVPRATTAAVAVADLDDDGRLDAFLGSWYWKYGDDLRAFPSVLLTQSGEKGAGGGDGTTKVEFRASVPPWVGGPPGEAPGDEPKYDPAENDVHRPLYGAMVVTLGDFSKVAREGAADGLFDAGGPWGQRGIWGLAYGRRANLLWAPYRDPRASQRQQWFDLAPRLGLDGDAIRHGKYPEWLKERAKTDKRFDREDEKPFRSHGNTFDGAVGDIDNDGDWDLFIAEITHAWAGESSDRSRFLVNQLAQTGVLKFDYDPRLSVDRVPPADAPPEQLQRWNQGDLYCDLADLDNDGRLDLVLASGDYPDPPPFDERLRVFHQRADGTFEDVTHQWGIDHVGAAQISLADVDLDGDVDILVGQSFMRFTPEMIEATTKRQATTGPAVRLYLNQTIEQRKAAGLAPNGYTFLVSGNPRERVARDAIGTIVRLTAAVDGKAITQQRQLVGIGGCGGRQNAFQLHIALPEGAARADSIEIDYPARDGKPVGKKMATVPPPGVVKLTR